MNLNVMKINNIEYVMEVKNGNKFFYKMVNNKKVELTSQELGELLKELGKMQQVEKFKEEIISKIKTGDFKNISQIEKFIEDNNLAQYKEKIMVDINEFINKLNIEQIKNSILDQIKSKQITNEKELREYIDKYGLENKEELLKYGKEELDRLQLGLTPVEEFFDFVKEIYKTKMGRDELFRIDLKMQGSSITKYFDIAIFTEVDGKVEKMPKNYYVRFDDETMEKLIIPTLREISSKGILNNDYVRNNDDVINDRYNYNLINNKKAVLNVSNIEEDYAKKLKEEALKIEREYGKNNGEEVSEQIEKEYNQELYNEELEQEFTYDEIEEMKAKQMSPDDYRQLYKGGPKLVRAKDENKGFAMSLPIFIITEFVAVLLILMQIILLK